MQTIIEGYRLSPQQRHLWALQPAGQPTPSTAYRAWCATRIAGPLDRASVRSALECVVARHEILHTIFRGVAGASIPLQVIVDATHLLAFRADDLSDMQYCEQETRLETLLRETVDTPFDLERGPVIAVTLVTLSPTEGRLFLCMPALYADGVSLRNIVRDIGEAYAAALHGTESLELPLQYVDFAQWQSDLLDAEDFALEREYWRERAVSTPLIPELPFAAVYEEQPAFYPQIVSVAVDSDLLLKIDTFVAQNETTCPAFFLACWQVLLHRITGQSDLILGVGYDNRKAEELRGALGLYAQYLPYLCHLRKSMPFSELARAVCADMQKMHSFQEYFDWDPIRTSTQNSDAEPFFGLSFDWWHQSLEIPANGISFLLYDNIAYIDRFLVRLSCVRDDSRLRALFHYDSHACTADDLRVVADQFYTLVCSAVSHPDDAVGSLNALSEQARRQVLYDFNPIMPQPPAGRSVYRLFEEQAARNPDLVAVTFGGQQRTYAELNAHANQLAHYLAQFGAGPDVPIGLCMERSLELLVGLLGILKAGGAYVPLDPALPAERRQLLLEEARVRLVVTTDAQRASLAQYAGAVVSLDSDSARIAERSIENPASRVASDNLVYVMFTSGSTGTPKGVGITHGNLLNYLGGIMAVLDLPVGASYALLSTFAADLGNTVLFPSLCSGGCLHVLPQEYTTDPNLLLAYVQQHPIDCMKIVPSHLQALLGVASMAALLPRRWLVLGGEAATAGLLARVQAASPTCRILNHYGPTETTVGVLTHQVVESSLRQHRSIMPLGRPLANTQVYLLGRDLQPVSIWAQGEIYVGGASVARGYFARPELTAERFVPNPFADGGDKEIGRQGDKENSKLLVSLSPCLADRLYRTGDRARYSPDGNIEFLGRIDNQIKLRGYRIELGEIATTLERYPEVRTAAVIAREDAPGALRLVAYVVPADDEGRKTKDESASSSSVLRPSSFVTDLRSFLAERLPDYMLPAAFVVLDALPLTANGKLDVRALPAPAPQRPDLASSYAPPATPTQATLAQIWAQVLRLEQVGIHDNFFALGGDSILSIQVVARAARAGLSFSPKDLFQHPTIAQLATLARTTAPIAAAEADASGPVPLTPIQRWFFAQELPAPQHYNQALLLRLRARLDLAALTRALRALVAQHDALRLRFRREADGWHQELIEAGAAPRPRLALLDLAVLPVERRAAALEAAATQVQSGLDLAAGAPLRALVVELGAGETRLLLVIHHLAVDGVSWRILLDQLSSAYAQAQRGEVVALGPASSSFAAWARALHAYAQRDELSAQAAYWQTMGATGPALPRDATPATGVAANTHATAATERVTLDVAATRALLTQVPQAYQMQIDEVLLTALGLALADWMGSRAVRVDLEGHGRAEELVGLDLTRTVGWFTTLYPLRLELGRAGDDLGLLLKRVKEQLRRVPQRGIGYGLLRELRPADDLVATALRAQPLAEVRFNYLGQVDATVPMAGAFAMATEGMGRLAARANPRSYALDITALIAEGQLQVSWSYSSQMQRGTTIARLAQRFIEQLAGLIAHCQSPQAGGYTPSDFPDAKLDQRELDALFAQFDDTLVSEDEQEMSEDGD